MSSTKHNYNKGPRACLNCRRRKTKCDGARPCCGACSTASPAFRDCEYASSTPTRTQRLLDRISSLEARLALYEHSAEVSNVERTSDFRNNRVSNEPIQTTSLQTMPQPKTCSVTAFNPSLIKNFMCRRADLGFFIDSSPYYSDEEEVCLIPQSRTLTSALLYSTHLWALLISSTPLRYKSDYESFLLGRIFTDLSTVVDNIKNLPRYVALQYIQTQVLLAQYFLWYGQIEEGKTHARLAFSSTLESGLNPTQLYHHHSSNPSESTHSLPSPEDREAIEAFQVVVTLYTCLSAVDTSGSRSNIEFLHTNTLWNSTTVPTGGSSSDSALLLKGALLWQDACKYKTSYREDMCPDELLYYSAQFQLLDNEIRQLIALRSQTFGTVSSTKPTSRHVPYRELCFSIDGNFCSLGCYFHDQRGER